jgi:hypothetical protein
MDGETTCTRRGLLRTGVGLTATVAVGTAAGGTARSPAGDPSARTATTGPAAPAATGGPLAQTEGEDNATNGTDGGAEATPTATGPPAANRTALQTMLAMLVLGFLSPLLLLLILRFRGGE